MPKKNTALIGSAMENVIISSRVGTSHFQVERGKTLTEARLPLQA